MGTSVMTDNNGRAESTLTLGPNLGANAVTVSVTRIQGQQMFNAEGIRIPKTFEIISGDDQQDAPGTALANPFVVEVRDQYDDPLPDVEVMFSVTSGGGTLSGTSAMTDVNGRAESTLTLGPNLGANSVTVSVTRIQEQQTFNAEGIRIPKAFEIISGDDQEGVPEMRHSRIRLSWKCETSMMNPCRISRSCSRSPAAGVCSVGQLL